MIPRYVFFDNATGELVRAQPCAAGGLTAPGETAFAHPTATPATHYLQGGELRAYTPEQAAAKASRPGVAATWSNTAQAWIDPRGLDALRQAKNDDINAWRAAADLGTFHFAGRVFQADENAQRRINAVAAKVARLAALPPGFPGVWKDADNSLMPVPDLATWDAFYDAMLGQGEANFARSQVLKSRLAEAQTPADIAAITWIEQ